MAQTLARTHCRYTNTKRAYAQKNKTPTVVSSPSHPTAITNTPRVNTATIPAYTNIPPAMNVSMKNKIDICVYNQWYDMHVIQTNLCRTCSMLEPNNTYQGHRLYKHIPWFNYRIILSQQNRYNRRQQFIGCQCILVRI